MALNFPGPWELRINYTTQPAALPALEHQMRLSVNVDGSPAPGLDFTAYDYVSKDSSIYDLDSWVDAWLALLAPIMHSANNFSNVELWKYTPGTFDAAFYSSADKDVDGTSGTSPFANGQVIWTFRSQNGGHARVNLMETIYQLAVTKTVPTGDSNIDNIAAAVIAADSPIVARDDGYLFSAIHFLQGQNEALFKKRYRP